MPPFHASCRNAAAAAGAALGRCAAALRACVCFNSTPPFRAPCPEPELQGSWIIRQSVGTTPVLLGQKLTTKYSRGPNYLEAS